MLQNNQTYLKILRCSHRKVFRVCLANIYIKHENVKIYFAETQRNQSANATTKQE